MWRSHPRSLILDLGHQRSSATYSLRTLHFPIIAAVLEPSIERNHIHLTNHRAISILQIAAMILAFLIKIYHKLIKIKSISSVSLAPASLSSISISLNARAAVFGLGEYLKLKI